MEVVDYAVTGTNSIDYAVTRTDSTDSRVQAWQASRSQSDNSSIKKLSYIFSQQAIFQTLNYLAGQWREEVKFTSSIDEMISHPCYQAIITIGIPAIPFLLKELQERPDHWFAALEAITGDDPVDPGDLGDIRKMTEAWLRWGQQHGY